MKHHRFSQFRKAQIARQSGFTLIELLVALALGLLVSIGIVALFQSTSNTNRAQDALARLQENGRFAVNRLVDDVRMGFGQPVSTDVTSLKQAYNRLDVFQSPMIAPTVYVANLESFLPRWVAGDVVAATGPWPPTAPYPLSPRWLIQGHECSVGSTACTPTVPATLPPVGPGAGNRVQGADVLTVRYIDSPGWAIAKSSGGAGGSEQTCDANGRLTLLKVIPMSSEPPTNFGTDNLGRPDLALLWSGGTASIFQVRSNVGGPGAAVQELVPINVLPSPGPSTVPCAAEGTQGSAMLYNLSRDLRTATYFLQLVADPNPDARAGRVIPALMRWVQGAPLNNRPPEIMATGVERLDFLYGVETLASRGAALTPAVYNFMDANQVQTSGTVANCPLPPEQYLSHPTVVPPNYLLDANCLWRGVRTIEAHMLINTINDIQFLTPTDEAYRYSVNGGTALTYNPATLLTGGVMPNGLQRGRMMRREFTAYIAVRNGTP